MSDGGGGDALLGGRFRLGQLHLDGGGLRVGWSARGGDLGPLVLVPGSFDDRGVFASLIAHLGEGVAVCVIELPGHGRSWPPAVEGSIERFAEQVVGVLDVLYCRPVCVGGHSIGGMVAIQVAGTAPERVAGVISLEGWTNHHAARAAFGGDMTGTLSAEQEAERQARRARVTDRWGCRPARPFPPYLAAVGRRRDTGIHRAPGAGDLRRPRPHRADPRRAGHPRARQYRPAGDRRRLPLRPRRAPVGGSAAVRPVRGKRGPVTRSVRAWLTRTPAGRRRRERSGRERIHDLQSVYPPAGLQILRVKYPTLRSLRPPAR